MSGRTVGYVVCLWEDGAWNLTWDGELHPTRAAAVEAADYAETLGFTVKVARVDAAGGAT